MATEDPAKAPALGAFDHDSAWDSFEDVRSRNEWSYATLADYIETYTGDAKLAARARAAAAEAADVTPKTARGKGPTRTA